MVATNIWFWVGFIAFVLAMLALDLGVFNKTPHVVKATEATLMTALWVGLALLFAGGLAYFVDRQTALTFLTGYVIEESLSVDNIFVIVLIFQYFAVPPQYQHRVLFWGILGALVMRGIFIGVGAALLARFEWIIYIFGALLVVTGIRMALKQDEEFDGEQNPVVKFVRRFLPVSHDYHGKHFFTLENGKRYATPLLLVLVLVEATDLIFAIDSIPAIFGISRDPFVVFTSNIFAVMGLRSLFFLLASVVTKFHLLKYGLAVILTFVGAKMLLEHWVHIPIMLSLGIVVAVLGASIVASLVWPQLGRTCEGKTGSMFGTIPRNGGG
jgi:tellurite resistance protein TerC